ncbi:solute carrier family 22 member 6 isoform X1 [Dunckerocampus dactyliophorus]|uniref:solute carrier family 22 member 6 isoform X1 n=2 Tax=Dunckerocampus dactyliophorus TaxID=161453 RepID=UPI002405B67C|nr:solute carrier family 22 member 6 isoform X1 [Dunckerocampus dactyliophorus]XP_054611182.1 solute carrier family 22 member 6 isoform X1 [Dunckerocampus dactyliophorus]XP_054611183.1 solute carrier family 22 member 6 isoform X1 [Dunckerocampus dactyliophorus]
MGFSELLEEMGGFGRYQWLHVTLISLPGLLMASQNLLNNFVSGTPSHHCSLSANHSLLKVEEKDVWKAFIPLDSSGTRLDRCSRYVTPQWHLLAANSSANTSHLHTESCLDGWTFDRSEFLATTVSEWELVCSLRPLKQMIQTIYMGGVLSGAIIYGGLSDRFGRRTVLIWSYLQLGILGCSSALSPSYSIYCVFRFLSGMAVSGVILNSVSLKVEWIPTKTRTLVGTLTSFFFTFGQLILAGLAYWLRDWRKLQVVVCAPHFLFFAYSWWYSESARWMVLKRKSEKALKTLHRVARINGKKEVVDKLTLEVLHSHMSKEMESSQTMLTAYDLVRTPGMRRISMCLIAAWFSTSFAYYGLAMDLQKFGLSIYMIQIIFGAVDFPAKLLALGMLSYLGRRVTQASCLIMSALVIFANIFVPADMQTVRTTVACLGKAFTSASFTTVYLYTGELYPTIIRQTGMGLVSTMARVGSMAAPAVLILDEVFPSLPSVVYGGAAVVASGFACFLPETLNVPLPDTIQDVEERWSGRSPAYLKKKAASSEDEQVVSFKEVKELEGSGLNAL